MSQEVPGFEKETGPDFKRLLLAGLLMSLVLIVFNSFFAPQKISTPVTELSSQVEKKEEAPREEKMVAQALVLDPSIEITSPDVPSKKSNFEIAVSNSVTEDVAWPKGGYQLSTSNIGASISSLAVFGYKEPILLLEGESSGLFFLKSRSIEHSLSEKSPYELVSSTKEEIAYKRVTPEGLQIVRRYQFSPDNYFLTHQIEITNLLPKNQQVELDLVLKTEGEVLESSFLSAPVKDLNFLARKDESIERHAESDVLKKPVSLSGPVDFVGFEQRYFLVSILPKDPGAVESVLAQAKGEAVGGEIFKADVVMSLKALKLAPSETKTLEFSAYVGPKQLSLLKLVNGRGLDETVNFGWFGIVSRPLLWMLVEIYGFVHNFGIAIILLTLLIKLLTFPLVQKSLVSMQKIKKIAPELKELQKKYGHDRTMMSQKQMELYKEKGVNPMAGCLPMFLQFPIWIGLYQMLNNSIEIFQKPFGGWLMDLTSPDPYYVLPILMGVSMVIQQLLQPAQDDQKAVKYAMLGSSLLFTYIMINLPAGLSLYMLTNNILTVLQQLVIKKRFDTQTV